MRKAIIKKENLKYNIDLIKKAYDNIDLIGVVKANAYGHGAKEIATYLYQFGINKVAVVTFEEAQELLELDINQEIIILGPSCIEDLKTLNTNRVIQLINYEDYYYKIKNINVRKQVNVNTGMNRMGIAHDDDFLLEVLKDPQIEGFCTHFFYNVDKELTQTQINKCKQINNGLINHTSITYPEIIKDSKISQMRVGTSLYGYENFAWAEALKPVMYVYAKIITVNKVKKGESISYSAKFTAERDMIVGTVSFGYSDGLPFNYQDGYVYYNNQRCKILGRLTMDFIMIDLTDVEYKICDYVEIIGDNITIREIANKSQSITYETLVKLGKRVKRIYQ